MPINNIMVEHQYRIPTVSRNMMLRVISECVKDDHFPNSVNYIFNKVMMDYDIADLSSPGIVLIDLYQIGKWKAVTAPRYSQQEDVLTRIKNSLYVCEYIAYLHRIELLALLGDNPELSIMSDGIDLFVIYARSIGHEETLLTSIAFHDIPKCN